MASLTLGSLLILVTATSGEMASTASIRAATDIPESEFTAPDRKIDRGISAFRGSEARQHVA